ncbi:hypothetical protein SDRG_04746 [Saprolegnia diclina VS20]|uniref:Helicase-associated domain-containing protein n=1 Tax=Saprolegnia diclina (strain VS20) TaxID=1156394 RepID=T0QI90_SAPDV|nr:hypothetical protein SDRG_04746 [Saprolegnia diclina VS20]EQC37719.1 hypothetical protein SDRG_04746 [Saprolegnia diclina VS20]|eukprot:XP_008608652.1 hypothetical protein SDRG_04746 [Saprolegnia diclina VS20]
MTLVWATQLQAWIIYRYLHGHCRIPYYYVVPATDLWPTSLRGVALGKSSSATRYDAAMYAPDRFAQLDAMGFEWSPPPRNMHRSVVYVNGAVSVRHVPLPALVRALEVFRERHGHLVVPDDFLVPENDAAWPHEASNVLLARAPQTLCAHFFELSDADVATVHGLSLCNGLPRWGDAKQLLALYVKSTGEHTVPIEFVVPAAAPWPQRFHHALLGELAWYLGRKRHVLPHAMLPELDALGIVFETPATWAGIVRGLRMHVAKVGDADVPSDFVVPDDWDRPLVGLRLGRYVVELRKAVALLLVPKETLLALSTLVELPPEVTPALLRYAPRPVSPSRKRRRVDLRGIDDEKVDALALYRHLFGDLAVPRDFVVDYFDDRWPAPLGGWALGAYAVSLRHRRHLLPPEKLASLDALGFLWQLKPGAISVTTSLSRKVATFSVLLAALRAYKAKTGHVIVPPGFSVPLRAPWPSDAAGINLRPVLTLLRHHFYDLSANEAEDLHALGICSDLPSWASLLELLRCYTAQFGHGGIGLDFIVPSTSAWPTQWHKAPLGEIAYSVGLLVAGFAADKVQQLSDTGFLFNTPATWARIVDGLRLYHRFNGCIDVPPAFVVPYYPAWPINLHGLPLGRLYHFFNAAQAVQMLPSATQLDVAGFANVAPTPDTAALWAVVLDALSTFRSVFGHTEVPSDFAVPATAPWRPDSHGLQLGAVVTFLKTRRSMHAQYKAPLAALGVMSPTTTIATASETTDDVPTRPPSSSPAVGDDRPVGIAPRQPDPPIAATKPARCLWSHTLADKLEALAWFRAEHGHLVAPKRYVVPMYYPTHLHGIRLHDVVASLRAATEGLPSELEAALDAIGFPWHPTPSTLRCITRLPGVTTVGTRFVPLHTVFQALFVFRRLFGPVEILPGFLVPANDSIWPAPTHHIDLSCAVDAIRTHLYELPDADFQWTQTLELAPDLPDFDGVLGLLRVYRATFGTGAVARDFAVPLSGGDWPSAWRGLALGDLAWRIGLKTWALEPRKVKLLDDTGFVFNDTETWARIVAGLRRYCTLFHTTSVPPTYRVPPTEDWPPHLHNMDLGRWVATLLSARELRLLPPATRSTVDALLEAAAKDEVSPPPASSATIAECGASLPRPIVLPESTPVAAASSEAFELDDSGSDNEGESRTAQDDQCECLVAAPVVDCLTDRADWVIFTGALQSFFRDFGHADVPFDFGTVDGVPLGHLVQQLRNGDIVLSSPRKADLRQLHLPSFRF